MGGMYFSWWIKILPKTITLLNESAIQEDFEVPETPQVNVNALGFTQEVDGIYDLVTENMICVGYLT